MVLIGQIVHVRDLSDVVVQVVQEHERLPATRTNLLLLQDSLDGAFDAEIERLRNLVALRGYLESITGVAAADAAQSLSDLRLRR